MNTKLLTNVATSFETIFPKTKKKKTTDLNQLPQTCQFQQFHETYLAKNHSCILSNPLILKYWNWSNSWMKYIILETPNRRWRHTIRRNLNYLSLVSIQKRERKVYEREETGESFDTFAYKLHSRIKVSRIVKNRENLETFRGRKY